MLTKRGKYEGRRENPPNPEGRPLVYDEPKKRRHLTVTQTGWYEIQQIAETHNLSVSELLERLARGEFKLVRKAS
jgi:hypothetical protein